MDVGTTLLTSGKLSFLESSKLQQTREKKQESWARSEYDNRWER